MILRIALAIVACISLALAAIQSTCKTSGQVALTFDYGPGSLTGRLLDILFKHRIPATFHVTVDLFRNSTLTEYVRRAHYEGHTIGIFVPDAGPWEALEAYPEEDGNFMASMIEQITMASNWITSVTGSQPRYIRFGSKKIIPLQLRRSLEQQLGLAVTKPKVKISDESNKVDSIWSSVNKAFAAASPQKNSFILSQRDVIPNSVASVEKIVEYIQEQGFQIVPMAQCVPPRPIKS